MTSTLLIILIAMDIVLFGIVYFMSRERINPGEILTELTEERRLLGELRHAVKEEIDLGQQRCRQMLEKITRIATEAELEVKNGGETISRTLKDMMLELNQQIDDPLKEMQKKHMAMESLLKRVEREKSLLQKMVSRGEKICGFFDKRIPYEEVLTEISDKKYADARALLAEGMQPQRVAREVGLSETEVKLLAAVGP